MGIATFPAPSAASKTAFRTTITSGTSWTVPAGVTYVNATLIGGGGGGTSSVGTAAGANTGSAGGTTTFTGATSATGGLGAVGYARIGWSNVISITGVAATVNSGLGGGSASSIDYAGGGGTTAGPAVTQGNPGQIITSTLATTPGASITYAIGGGGTAGTAPSGGTAGGLGGSGRIELEYWA